MKDVNEDLYYLQRKRREELEKRENERLSEMTPEELVAEKLRRQKMQEESDLLLAKQLLGNFQLSFHYVIVKYLRVSQN